MSRRINPARDLPLRLPRWRAVDASHLVALARLRAVFKNGNSANDSTNQSPISKSIHRP